jgi:hexosaminidase
MAYAKLNVLHWHIVDTQSWPIESRVYPNLWSAAWSPQERYTLEDAAAVVEYARQRGVMIMPE